MSAQHALARMTAKQALKQLSRQTVRLHREIQKQEDAGRDPWQYRMDLDALNYAIALVEERMHRNAAKHEGGTPPATVRLVREGPVVMTVS